MNYKSLIYLACLALFIFGFNQKKDLPDGFVYVKSVIPVLDVELRYYSTNNFVGDTIDGYKANELILTRATAKKLKLVPLINRNSIQMLLSEICLKKNILPRGLVIVEGVL